MKRYSESLDMRCFAESLLGIKSYAAGLEPKLRENHKATEGIIHKISSFALAFNNKTFPQISMYESLKRLKTFQVRNAMEISNFTVSAKQSTVVSSLT